jgi:hypothetical protein
MLPGVRLVLWSFAVLALARPAFGQVTHKPDEKKTTTWLSALQRPEHAPPDQPPDIEELDARRPPEAASPWTLHPLALEAHLSLGGPYGLIGAAFDFSPSPGFSASLGGGMSGATRSPQVATTSRFRLLLTESVAVGTEGGLSLGSYDDGIDCATGSCPPSWHWDRAVWGSLGLMLEARTDEGLSLRWGFGASGIFNVVDGVCQRCDASDEPNVFTIVVPYVGVTVGRAFTP